MAKKNILIDYDVNGNRIYNLGAPISQTDAISKDFVDEKWIDNLLISNHTFESQIITPPSSFSFRLNDLVVLNATEIYISVSDINTFDITPILKNLNENDVLKIQQTSNSYLYSYFKVVSIVDNTTYYTINVIYMNSSIDGSPVSTNDCTIEFIKQFTPEAAPETQVFFDQDTPTTFGVVFDPDVQSTIDVLYISSTNSSTWIWNGSAYVTYSSPVVVNTPFNLLGTTIDAGGSKTANIERSGIIRLNHPTQGQTFNAKTNDRNIYIKSLLTGSNLCYSYNANMAVGTSTLHDLSIHTNSVERIGITSAGVVSVIQDMYANSVRVGKGGGNISSNTALGASTLNAPLNIGDNLTAIGHSALYSNLTGVNSTAIGHSALYNNLGGSNNTSVGLYSLYSNVNGNKNVAIGNYSGRYLLDASSPNTTPEDSVFIGYGARSFSNNDTNQIVIGYDAPGNGSNTATLGNNSITQTYLKGNVNATTVNTLIVGLGNNSIGTNTGVGISVLNAITTGNSNVAIGYQSMIVSTTAVGNTAVGYSTLLANTTGNSNTAIGYNVLKTNTTGGSNVGIGGGALRDNSTGASNVAVGGAALNLNTTGASNTAVGVNAMSIHTTGNYSVAIGNGALQLVTTGYENTALGFRAGYANSVSGVANTTGFGNIYLGNQAVGNGAANTNETVIGYNVTGNGSNTVTIGNTSVTNTYLRGNVNINGAYTLPTTDGTANYMIKTDGSGNLSWAEPQAIGGSLLSAFLYDTASDIATYKKVLTAPSTGGSVTITKTNVTAGEHTIIKFATEPTSPDVNYINQGWFQSHFHASRTGAGSNVHIYVKIYKRDSLNVETLIATLSQTVTALTTSSLDYNIEAYNTELIHLDKGVDRLVYEFIAINLGSGSPDVNLLIENGYDSRVDIPVSSADTLLFAPINDPTFTTKITTPILNISTEPTLDNALTKILVWASDGTVKKRDASSFSVATSTGNILYVSTTGSDTDTTRAGHVGDAMKPFLTIETAVAAAISGDKIHVFSGTYTLTTTATNGIAKDGITYQFEPNVILNKSTLGDVFNDTGFTVGCNIYGYPNINKTGSAGHIIYYLQNLNYIIEYGYLVNSAVGTCLSYKYTGNGTNNLSIKGISAIATAGLCYDIQNFGYLNLDFGLLIKSTSTYAIQSNIVNGAGVWDINKGTIRGEQIITTAGVYSAHIRYTQLNADVVYSNYVYSDGNMFINWNGTIDRLYAGSFKHTGTVVRYDGGTDNIILDRVSFFIATLTGYCSINYLYGNTGLYNNSITGAGTLIINSIKDQIPNWLAITSTTVIIKSKYNTTTYNSAGGGLTMTNGKVVFEKGFTYPNQQSAIVMSGTAIVELETGTCENTNSTAPSNGSSTPNVIDHRGGTLILRNPTLKTAHADAEVIVAPTVAVSIYVQPSLLSNRVENGGVLVAKKQKMKISVGSVSAQSLVVNDGSGGNETFTISDLVTYDTTAKQAQQFAALVNASGTLDITASQDTPGTDVYFYLESDVAGVPFSYIPQANSLSNPGTTIRKNSYDITNIVGGNIIEDADVK